MSGPGRLDLVALSLATGRLTWRPDHLGQVTAEGYAITTTGDNPCYHLAYKPGGRIPANELGAGAGALGLAKCKQLCERHLERASLCETQPDLVAQVAIPVSNNATQPSSNNMAAPSSNNVPTSAAQTALF